MKISFLPAVSRYSSLRYARLVEAMKSFHVPTELYFPFEEYTHAVIDSAAVSPATLSYFEKYKERGMKLILHLTEATTPYGAEMFDAIVSADETILGTQRLRHKEFRKIESHLIEDGVLYRPMKKASTKISKLVWFGNSEDVGSLTTVEPFLKEMSKRGADLTVLVDDPDRLDVSTIVTDVKPFTDDLSDFDMAVLPCGSPWAVKTAWMQNLPVIYDGEFPVEGEHPPICRGVQKASDWMDFTQLHEVSAQTYQKFRRAAREQVMGRDLIQHRCADWLRVFESL